MQEGEHVSTIILSQLDLRSHARASAGGHAGPVARAAHAFVPIVSNIVVLVLLCGGLALVLVRLVGIDRLTAYLATSSGGMDSLASRSSPPRRRRTLPFVMALDAVRVVIVLAVGPTVAR